MAGTATGCYKCGRPGHWSRDCPFSAPDSNPNPNPNPNSNTADLPPSSSSKPFGPRSAIEKPKKIPRTRPKLTPELLLSDDGLGYVLRYFPRSFKYHGRGHEVIDNPIFYFILIYCLFYLNHNHNHSIFITDFSIKLCLHVFIVRFVIWVT